ncbi:MAG TPA: aconitate hydratase [Nitriliruptoraceae bacterium]|nr:aconitate hydratase [Nitriliruptoraceae bacterium]
MTNVATRILEDHLVEGDLEPGTPIAIRIDQTLTQDATGTLVMLELEAMGLDRIHTELSTQYVDHNLIQEDHKNPDDHRFLQSAAARFGLHYSRPGNGVSHPVHQQRFGRPGATLAGSDSHSPAAGAIGMLAIGSGGLDVALAMAGEPLRIKAPEIWGIELTGQLPDWVSAKDVILEMLRRHDVDGGVGRIIEYHGPGLATLSAMDRHVIANMGAELGATTTVFPADDTVREYMASYGREDAFTELVVDDPTFHVTDSIDLSTLEPLIALPTSPGNVTTVAEVAGQPISQAYVGSSANPGYRDVAIVAQVLKAADAKAHEDVSLDINPSSRSILADLIRDGHLYELVSRGARIHQAGCNGCIGMGQAPATDTISLRTTPRNFPDRSGTKEDRVHLCSPETAVASAITGVITDPRTLPDSHGISYPSVGEPDDPTIDDDLLQAPPSPEESLQVEIVKGPNIDSLPTFDALPDELSLPIVLKVGDDISTDEILRAGTEVLPYRSNIPRIAEFTFDVTDPTYPARAKEVRDDGAGGHVIIGGTNYGQGSSREHAAIAPRYLGLRVVLVKDYARIHWQNLANFGVLALEYVDPTDHDRLEQGDVLTLGGLHELVDTGNEVEIEVTAEDGSAKDPVRARHSLSDRQREHVRAGGTIQWMAERI